MPREHYIDKERGAIFVMTSGVFTEMEFVAGAALTIADPDFHPDHRVLVDFSGVTRFEVSAFTLTEFVRKQAFSKKSRRAFVVGSGFGASFVNYGKASGAVEQIQIFHDRAGALAWLNEGVPPEKMLT